MFILGNHTIDEILQAVATDFKQTEIYYTVDQLQDASIAITSDPREITDKNGNIVRRIFKSKNGEFNSTNAFLHPALMNAASGSDIEQASDQHPIDMPKIIVAQAKSGATVDVDVTGAGADLKVIGIYGNGANSNKITVKTTGDASFDPEKGTGDVILADDTLTIPAIGTTGEYPVSYMIMYTRSAESGYKLTNTADKFPSAVTLTLWASYVDPCSEDLKPMYIVIPNFMADPSVTINLSSENQEVDFNGTLQVDYCSGVKVLYYIYYPDEELVESGVVDGGEGN